MKNACPKLIFTLLLLLLLSFPTQALAATGILKQINFQGKVVNTNGTNVTNGDYSFLFCIYTVASPTTACTAGANNDAVWRESKTLTVTDGIFRTQLGDTTTLPGSVDFNTDNIYLGTNFNSDGQMTPLVRFTAVPYAFNALKVAGLTVTDTTGTLTIPNTKTISFADAFTTSGLNPLTLTTTGSTNVTLPTTGTLLTNTAVSAQTITSTQTSGTVLGVTDSTAIGAAIVGQAITLSGTGAFDQTGLQFNLSNATGTNLNDIVGTGSTWKVSKAGALTVASCVGCGGGGSTLQQAYDASSGNTVLTTTARNIAFTLGEVATPTSLTLENQDTAGVSAQRIFNSIASGTLTNGLLLEQTGVGTMTNAIQIAETAGTITDGILITGTLANILNSASIDITGAGAITGATGITSATGNVAITAGDLTLNAVTRITNAGVGTFITGTVLGSQTFTTNNIVDSGALTIATGANGALTLNPNGTGILVHTLDGTTSINDAQFNRSGTLTAADALADIFANRTVVTNSVGSLNDTANFVQFTSAITGTGTDTGSVLGLTQSAAGATGDVLAISNSGTGKDISGTSNLWNISKAGAATFATVNGNTITTGTGVLTLAAGKTFTVSNTLTLAGTDGSTLNVGAGGTLGTNAFTSTAYAPLASPTFTGTVTIPTPFTIGAVSMTATGTQLNYLNAATGTTGTATTNLVFSTSPTLVAPVLGAATATSVNGLIITSTAGTLTIPNNASAALILSGNFGTTLTSTGTTNVTLPTSGTLVNSGVTTLSSLTTVGSLVSGTIIGSQTFTTNNIVDSGALTIKSGGTSALTLDTSGAAAINIGNTNATSLALGNATTNPTLTLTGSGLTTLGGGLTFSGSTARTITGPNTGAANALTITTFGNISGLTLNTAAGSSGNSGVITIATGTVTTSGTSGAVNINSGASNTNTLSTGAITIQSGAITTSGTSGNVGLEVGTGGTLGTINIGNATAAPINIGTAATAKTIQIGNAAVANTITIGNASATGVSITDDNWSITAAGAGTFVSVTSPTYTGAGVVTLSSGGSSGLTFDSASGDITVAANDGLTFAATTLGNNGSRNVTINSGTGGTTATLIVKLDTSGTVVTTDTTTLNNAVGVALNTTTIGQAVRVAINGVVTATADNAVTAGDYIGLGTTTAGRAKSLGTTYPSTAGIQVIGRALGTQATPGSTFLLMLNGIDNNVSAGAACSTCVSFATGTADNTTGTNNLIHLTKSGVDKFIVSNAGGLTINGTDSTIVKESTADFASGTVGSSLTNTSGQNRIEMSEGTVPTSGQGTITTTSQPAVNVNIGAGSMSISRPDGKYVVLHGGAVLTSAIYDSVANTFSAGQTVVTGNGTGLGAGALLLPKADGKYVFILGAAAQTVAATSLIDPVGTVTSVAGPPLITTPVTGAGTVAFKRPDGKYLVTVGASTPGGATQIFDPVPASANFVAGPAAAGGAVWSIGALVLPRPDGKALIVAGGSTSNTNIYDPYLNTFSAGPSLDGNQAAGTCGINNLGSVALRRGDGKFVILSRATVAAIYDPVANTMTCNTGVTNVAAMGDGGHAIPLQNFKKLILAGGNTATAFVYNQDTNTFSSYTGTAPTAITAGAHSILRHDGQWQIITGTTTTTNKFDTGLPMFDPFPSQVTAAAPSAGGSCTAGTHSYYVTFIGSVESELSNKSNIVSCTAGSGTVALTTIPVGPVGTTQRKIYRTITGDTGVPKLLTTINDNTTVIFSDTVADASLGANYTVTAAATWYTSEDISNTYINANSTMRWNAQLEAIFSANRNATTNTALSTMQFYVKTAVNSGGCAVPLANAIWQEVKSSGDLIRTVSGANCAKISVHFNRPFPKRLTDDRGTWTGNNSTVMRLDYVTPTLFGLSVDNSAVLKRSAFDFVEPNVNTATNPTVPAALTSNAPSAGGSCTAGNHFWFVTFVTNGAESQMSVASAVQNCATTNLTVSLTAIPTGPSGTTARKIYRTKAGALVTDTAFLLTTLSDNSTVTFSDTLADGSMGAAWVGTEASGPTGTRAEGKRVEAINNHLVLPFGRLTPTTQVGTSGFYMGQTSNAHPKLSRATGQGTTVIERDDKTFLILESGGQFAEVYDPVTQTFTDQSGAGNVPTASIAAGSFAIKRPDGKFLVIIGGATTTNIYDQYAPPGSRFTLGPPLSAASGQGAFTIPNTDGTFTILHGNAALTTSIYDPVRNTMIAGSAQITAGASCGGYAIPMGLPHNNQYKVITGANSGAAVVTTNMNYDANSKVFTAAPALAVGTGCGGFAFQRQDGYWIMIDGVTTATAQAATHIMNPNNGVVAAGLALVTNLAAKGGHVIPRPDGTFLVIHGNLDAGVLVTTSIYFPWGGAFNATAGANQGTWAVGPVMTLAQGVTTGCGLGCLSFQRPDGKWITIFGGSTASAAVNIIDAGWYSDGQYLSEQMNVPALAANSTLDWQQTPDNFVRMEVRTAASQAALSVAPYFSIRKPGGSIGNAGGETWVQVEINMRREFPTFCGNLNGVYTSTSGVAYCYRQISMPTVNSYQINNGMDILSLQNNGLNLLRVTSSGNIMSSAQGGFFAGGADLAENYISTQKLEPGEVVIIDSANSQGVLRSTGQYQNNVLGVVSTAPGFVAGAYTEDSYPIALVGRVPVKISTENGAIAIGDSLTASSIPGYAMKATMAGRVLGKALEDFKDTKGGEIMMFVNLTDYLGTPVELVMGERAQVLGVSTSEVEGLVSKTTQITTPSMLDELPENKQQILAFLRQLKDEQASASAGYSSEIFTDRVTAVKEVISPQIITDILYAKKIKADSIEGLEILTGKISGLSNYVAGIATASATPSAVLTNDNITQLGNITIESAKVTLDLTVLGKLTAGGGLIIEGPAEFKDTSIFQALADFVGNVIFRGDVSFLGRPTFNKDAGGFAVIEKDADFVDVTFDKVYETTPIVSTNFTFEEFKKEDGTVDDQSSRRAKLFEQGYTFIVVNRTNKGFTIVLNKKAAENVTLSWVALAVSDAKTAFGKKPLETPQPSPSPSPIPILLVDIASPSAVIQEASISGFLDIN